MRSPLIIFTIATLANLNVDARSLPTANQLLYQQRELTMFMHYSMCTYAPAGGCEQDTACRANPPSLFNPTGASLHLCMLLVVAWPTRLLYSTPPARPSISACFWPLLWCYLYALLRIAFNTCILCTLILTLVNS